MHFDEITISELFGNPAADRENPNLLRKYYLTSDYIDSVDESFPFKIIIGYKGTGKSALMKYAYLSRYSETVETDDVAETINTKNEFQIWLKPDVFSPFYDRIESKFIGLITLWKKQISRVIAVHIIESFFFKIISEKKKKEIIEWVETQGYKLDNFISIFIIKLEDEFVNYICNETETTPSLYGLYESKEVIVYIDDLDRGWGGTDIEKKSLSAFLNAISDITSSDNGIKFRVALRADVYMSICTLNETHDKFAANEVWIKWENIDIYHMLLKRISNYFKLDFDDENIKDLSNREKQKILSKVFDYRFSNTRFWKDKSTYRVLTSLIRRRPRDLVNLCRKAAVIARQNKHEKIHANDILSCLDDYSKGCLDSIEIEFQKEVPLVRALIIKMGPTHKELKELGYKNVYKFTTERLVNKIISQVKPNLAISMKPIDICNFLYRVGFITSRKILKNNYIERFYFDDNPDIISPHFDQGYTWEIHPAYRSIINVGTGQSWENTVEIDNE